MAYMFPAFDDLPPVPGQPQGCLWGFFDKDGKKDELGTLNLLTPDVVISATQEVQYGEHVQLDWSLSFHDHPGIERIPLEHNVKDMTSVGFVGFDDEIKINTQTSSQWDGLKHWAIQSQGVFYNGLTHEEAKLSTHLGIHNICRRGGIVGRGVFVDWLRWWEEHNPGREAPSPVSPYRISVSDIENVLEYQGTECRQGDILIMRTGMTRWHNNASTEERVEALQGKPHIIGVSNDMEMVRWLYSKHFAAVGGDGQGFESWPVKECCLHDWLLVHWGTPIGELWDLEELSRVCAKVGKWSFLFTSAPLNVTGGIASPPNAIAIL